MKVNQSPSLTELLEACKTVNGCQADTRRETTVFISPDSLFSEHNLHMVTSYSCCVGKTSHRLVHSKWNKSLLALGFTEL